MAPPVPHRYTHAGTLRAGVRVFMAESYKLPFRPDPYTPTAALSNIAASAVTGPESLKDLHSPDSLCLVVEPHDAWDRKLQALEREVRANRSLWNHDLLLLFLPVSQAPRE